MHSAARKFKYTIVEGRFTSSIAVLTVLGMRAGLFFTHKMPAPKFPDNGFAWKYLSPLFENPAVCFVCSTLAVLLIAWLMALLNNRFTLIRHRTSLPFITPLFLFSLHPYFLRFTPDYISIILVLCAFFPLLSSYQKYEAPVFSFKSSVLIAIAGLFQIYALLLLPLFWRGEFSMRGFHFKSLLSSLLGLFFVYWPVFSVFYFFDDIGGFIHPFSIIAEAPLVRTSVFSTLEWALAIAAFGLFLVYMFSVLLSFSRDKVLTQTMLQFIIFILSFLFAFQLIYWGQAAFMVLLGLALLSFLIAYLYSTTVSRWVVRSFFLVGALLLLFYFANYFSFLPFSL